MPPIVLPIFLPAVFMGVALLGSWRAWRRRALLVHGHWGGAAGLAGGYVAAHVTLVSWPSMPPERADDWMAWIALALGALGVTQRWWGARWFVAWPVRVLICAGVFRLLLRSQFEYAWQGVEAWIWTASLTMAAAFLWHTLETIASRRPGASIPLSLWSLCALSAGTFALSGSALFGQLAGALAGAFGAAVVLAWWAPGISMSGGAMTVFVPLYAGLLARAYFHADLPVYSAIAAYAAPLALWWGEQGRVVYQKSWKAALIRLALVSVPMALALGLAYWIVWRAPEPSYY